MFLIVIFLAATTVTLTLYATAAWKLSYTEALAFGFIVGAALALFGLGFADD